MVEDGLLFLVEATRGRLGRRAFTCRGIGADFGVVVVMAVQGRRAIGLIDVIVGPAQVLDDVTGWYAVVGAMLDRRPFGCEALRAGQWLATVSGSRFRVRVLTSAQLIEHLLTLVEVCASLVVVGDAALSYLSCGKQ